MNIFVLDENPITAAKYLDDVRIPKMCVESAQMMASALRRHGATDEQMPLLRQVNLIVVATKITPVHCGRVIHGLTLIG